MHRGKSVEEDAHHQSICSVIISEYNKQPGWYGVATWCRFAVMWHGSHQSQCMNH